MATQDAFYLGMDLSTQQLKMLVVDSSLKKVDEAKFDFDADAKGFEVHKGVMTNEAEGEVFAPVAMWLQALDAVLGQLKDQGVDFSKVKGISAAGMQHGSIFWSADAEGLMASLDPSKTLQTQMDRAFSYPYSPNWQDASTQKECDEFDVALGNEIELANVTGSKAHHRFTGPQILRMQRKHPEAYIKTTRITLVSSWLATMFLGKFAPFGHLRCLRHEFVGRQTWRLEFEATGTHSWKLWCGYSEEQAWECAGRWRCASWTSIEILR